MAFSEEPQFAPTSPSTTGVQTSAGMEVCLEHTVPAGHPASLFGSAQL
jgi:hypothetical protein